MTKNDLVQQLDTLITEEHESLVEGDCDKIEGILTRKEDLISELDKHPVEADELEPLRARLRRNHELFDEVLAGLRNVAARLGELNRARKTIHTYDSFGRKQSIDAAQNKQLEKRA